MALFSKPVAHQSRTIETSLTPEPSEGTLVARVRVYRHQYARGAIVARDIMGQEPRVIKLRASIFGGA